MRQTIFKNTVLYLGIAFYSLSTFAIMPALAGLKNDDRGEFPGERVGGGTRGGRCESSGPQLVALNPKNNLGVTARKQPLLYIAVPELERPYPAQFLVLDANRDITYETTVEVGRNREFVGILLPENTLKIGQDYTWEFVIPCDFYKDPDESNGESTDIFVHGSLRQVLPETPVAEGLTVEEYLALVQFYQDAGLWSDAVATVLKLRQNYPNSDRVLAQWRQVLLALDFSAYEGLLEKLLEIPVSQLQVSE
ncbi:MAG: DUF928 domain-containing protein [Cyanobacteria bacterium SBLK]|nr:DUF928 domain-containing protein [Cyanobacteria bacterium SBLK]